MTGKLLILGASSSVGRHLYRRLGPDGAVGTFNRTPVPGGRRFDSVAGSIKEVARPGEFTHAALLLADPQPDSCFKDPEASRRLNVDSIKRLLGDLWDLGITPLFASTEFVFDGTRGHYVETDAADPILLYGRQKKEIEDFLAASGQPHAVLRFAKVYGVEPGDGTILTAWAEQILKGARAIRCAADQVFSPVFVGDVGEALIRCKDHDLRGLFHLAGDAAWNRADLLAMAVAALRRRRHVEVEIERCSILDFPLPEKRPLDVSMVNAKLKAASGMSFTAAEDAMERILDRLL